MIYSRTEKYLRNNAVIVKNAHAVEVIDDFGRIEGYVSTLSMMRRDYDNNFHTNSQSFVFDNYQDAVRCCKNFFQENDELMC